MCVCACVSNDAWDGYGGAVIYSRTPDLNPESIPEIREAATSARSYAPTSPVFKFDTMRTVLTANATWHPYVVVEPAY